MQTELLEIREVAKKLPGNLWKALIMVKIKRPPLNRDEGLQLTVIYIVPLSSSSRQGQFKGFATTHNRRKPECFRGNTVEENLLHFHSISLFFYIKCDKFQGLKERKFIFSDVFTAAAVVIACYRSCSD